jgi:uncharacterized protein YndB with AHSA1/START domain
MVAQTSAQTLDRIEKQITLRAPRSRVWRALTNAEDFGTWFGVVLDSDFRPGSSVSGRITIPGFEHVKFQLSVATIEPERYFAYRWHPYAIDPKVDYSKEPTTLVEFRLDEVPSGTKLTVTESGFDRIPLARRAEAFRMNSGGWEAQLKNIERHVST